MTHCAHSVRWLLCLAAGLVAAGCPENEPADAGAADAGAVLDAAGTDAAAGDGAAGFDANVGFDARLDDGGVAPPRLRNLALPTQGRGPIVVALAVETGSAVALALEYDAGAGFRPLTLFEAVSDVPTPAPVNGVINARRIWDSYSDVAGNASVSVRVVVVAGSPAPLGAPVTIQINNDPEGDKLLLAPNPSDDLPGGGSSNVNHVVSLLTIAADGQSGSDTGVDVDVVGIGPSDSVFSPDGAQAFVLNGNDSTISVLDVTGASVSVRHDIIDHAPQSILALAMAPDGRALFVVESDGPNPKLVEVKVGGGVVVPARTVALDSVSQCIAVSPRGDLVAISRAGPNDNQLLELYDRRDLSVVGSVEVANEMCEKLRFSPAGHFVGAAGGMGMVTPGVFVLIDVTDPSTPTVLTMPAAVTAVGAPYDAVFHPAGTALLISSLDGNSVVSFALSSSGGLTLGNTVRGGNPSFALAAEMDIVQRGSRAGLVAVVTLSAVLLVQLNANGSAARVAAIDTGSATADWVEGVAIAP